MPFIQLSNTTLEASLALAEGFVDVSDLCLFDGVAVAPSQLKKQREFHSNGHIKVIERPTTHHHADNKA
jgi:hypothetical protein